MYFFAKKSVVIGGERPLHVVSGVYGGNSEANLGNPSSEDGNDYPIVFVSKMKDCREVLY